MSPAVDLDALSQEELARLLADILVRVARPAATGAPGPGDVLSIEEAARRLQTSTDSLYRKRKALKLGFRDPLDGPHQVHRGGARPLGCPPAARMKILVNKCLSTQ